MRDERDLADELAKRLGMTAGDDVAGAQTSNDDAPTLWLPREALPSLWELLRQSGEPWVLLELYGIDDVLGGHAEARALTLVYSLLRLEPFARLRVKTRLEDGPLEVDSAAPQFANADWYERDLRASAGVAFRAHPDRSPLPVAALAALDVSDELDVDVDLPRVLAMEALLGVHVPARANAIRVLRCELLRVASHLLWYGAFVEAVGANAPAFYVSEDARRVLEVSHALGGASPQRFIVGGVQHDLPSGWQLVLETLLEEMQPRARDYAEMALASTALQVATKGVCPMDVTTTSSWGVTGPVLRAAGLPFDLRKAQPYCGYERYELDVPAGAHGDLYDRVRVRLDELRQSLRVLEQCLATIPAGPITAPVPRALVPGEAMALVESSRGAAGCYVASDGAALFVRHRTPSFAHLQAATALTRGVDEADIGAIVSSIDVGAGARADLSGRAGARDDYGAAPGGA